jgi:hypothetical protein
VSPRRVVLSLCLAAAAVTACGGDPQPAASVDGTDITQQDVVDELEAIRANGEYVQAIEGAGTRVLGEDEGAFDTAFVATQLALRIQYAIVGNEVARRQLDVGDDCMTAARQSVVGQLARFSASGDGEAVFGEFPDGYQDYLVEREADVLALQGDLVGQPCVSDDAIEAYYEEHSDEYEQACGSHILVATRAEADEVAALLRGGADFAAVASERSTDAESAAQGGALPCVGRGQFIPEFDGPLFSQPVGAIGDPVESQFGFHVIRVESRGVAPLAEVRDQVAEAVRTEVQGAFGDWFLDALAAAEVTVDERYGEWDPEQADIVRGGAGSTTTTAPAPTG